METRSTPRGHRYTRTVGIQKHSISFRDIYARVLIVMNLHGIFCWVLLHNIHNLHLFQSHKNHQRYLSHQTQAILNHLRLMIIQHQLRMKLKILIQWKCTITTILPHNQCISTKIHINKKTYQCPPTVLHHSSQQQQIKHY